MSTKSEPQSDLPTKRVQHIRVPVFPAEKEAIEGMAASCGLTSTAEYVRRVAQGYEPPSRLDADAVEELLRLRADLGRMGGLLKLWLSDDRRLAGFDPKEIATRVRTTLLQVQGNQDRMTRVVERVINARGGGDGSGSGA